jgi:hypothetical protein
MTATLYRASSRPGIWAVLNLAIAGALVIGGVASGLRDMAVWAVLPGALAVVALLRQRWRFWVAIDDEGVTSSSGIRSSFADLQVVLARPAAGRSTRPFPIHAVFRDHVLSIPARLDAPSQQVYEALAARVPRHSSSAIADVVREFRDEQVATFGADRVWHCRGRSHLGWFREGEAGLPFGLGLMLAGAVAVPLGLVLKRSDFGGWACLGLFSGLVITLVSLAARQGPKRRKSWDGNGIVVGPLGMAVAQADLLGQLDWDEIQQVKYPARRRRGFRLEHGEEYGSTVLEIRVAGAVIQLFDVYDRALDVIHERIMANWKHTPQDGSAGGERPAGREPGTGPVTGRP